MLKAYSIVWVASFGVFCIVVLAENIHEIEIELKLVKFHCSLHISLAQCPVLVYGFFTLVCWQTFSVPWFICCPLFLLFLVFGFWKNSGDIIQVCFSPPDKVLWTNSVSQPRVLEVLSRNPVQPFLTQFLLFCTLSVEKIVERKFWIPFTIAKAFRNTACESSDSFLFFSPLFFLHVYVRPYWAFVAFLRENCLYLHFSRTDPRTRVLKKPGTCSSVNSLDFSMFSFDIYYQIKPRTFAHIHTLPYTSIQITPHDQMF